MDLFFLVVYIGFFRTFPLPPRPVRRLSNLPIFRVTLFLKVHLNARSEYFGSSDRLLALSWSSTVRDPLLLGTRENYLRSFSSPLFRELLI